MFEYLFNTINTSQISYDVDSGYVPNNLSDQSYKSYSEQLVSVNQYESHTFDQVGAPLITRNYPVSYERIFHDDSSVQESFKAKLFDEIKLQAFNLWLLCVDYQFSSGECKIQKRNELVKKFVKKDSIYTRNTNNRNQLVDSAIVHVKGAAFVAFQIEFAAYVSSGKYENLVDNSSSSEIFYHTDAESMTERKFENSSAQCDSSEKPKSLELIVSRADSNETEQILNESPQVINKTEPVTHSMLQSNPCEQHEPFGMAINRLDSIKPDQQQRESKKTVCNEEPCALNSKQSETKVEHEMHFHETTFYRNYVLEEIFKWKLDKIDKRKRQAFEIWIKCVIYQFDPQNSKSKQRNYDGVVRKLKKPIEVMGMNLGERLVLLEKGVPHVKVAAFKAFQSEFEEYVSSLLYKNSCR